MRTGQWPVVIVPNWDRSHTDEIKSHFLGVAHFWSMAKFSSSWCWSCELMFNKAKCWRVIRWLGHNVHPFTLLLSTLLRRQNWIELEKPRPLLWGCHVGTRASSASTNSKHLTNLGQLGFNFSFTTLNGIFLMMRDLGINCCGSSPISVSFQKK